MTGRWRAYLELSRVSNAPTVVSNALAGVGLASVGSRDQLTPWTIAAPAAACVLLYVAGMALNDILDRDVDSRERPHRPIPSGRITTLAAASYACALGAAALACLASVGLPALATGLVLVMCILLYDFTHSMSAWSVAIMGACRALVYLTAAAAVGMPDQPIVVLGPATLLLAYVAGFSVTARREVADGPAPAASGTGAAHRCSNCGHLRLPTDGPCPECGQPERVATAAVRRRFHPSYLLPVVLAAALLFLPVGRTSQLHAGAARETLDHLMVAAATVTLLLLTAWLAVAARRAEAAPPRIGAAVSMWIAAISLFDAYLLFLVKAPALGAAAVACFVLTRLLQRRIAGT